MLNVLPSFFEIVLWIHDNLTKALGVAHCQHLVKIPDHHNELFFPRFTASMKWANYRKEHMDLSTSNNYYLVTGSSYVH